MPRRRTSRKKIRVDKKRHLHNLKARVELKKSIKKFLSLLSAKSVADAKTLLKKIYSQLDKAAKKNIIPKGLAKRRKSRLTLRLGKTA